MPIPPSAIEIKRIYPIEESNISQIIKPILAKIKALHPKYLKHPKIYHYPF